MKAENMKTEKNVISVIIPVYNAADYLEEMLESLHRQNDTDLDILLIDDGSTDDSARIICKHLSQDNRMRYIYCIHNGVSVARNVGMSLARGKYIRFLDADDRIDDDSMGKMLCIMESDDEIDFVCGSFRSDSNEITYFKPDNLHGKTAIKDYVQEFGRSALTFYYGVVWNKLYRKELIDKYQIAFDESLSWCEDLLFNIEYYGKCKYVYCFDDVIYDYKNRKNSLTGKLEKEMERKRLNEINQFRYRKILKLLKSFDCATDEFIDSWDYITLKAITDDIAGFFTGKGEFYRYRELYKRYLKLKSLYELKENKALLRRRYMADSDLMVKILYKFSVKEHYIILFILLLIKDFISANCIPLKILWSKRERKGSVL